MQPTSRPSVPPKSSTTNASVPSKCWSVLAPALTDLNSRLNGASTPSSTSLASHRTTTTPSDLYLLPPRSSKASRNKKSRKSSKNAGTAQLNNPSSTSNGSASTIPKTNGSPPPNLLMPLTSSVTGALPIPFPLNLANHELAK
ncbi:hypothetical protein NMY22_g16515 [Coprinellus aureogranulatus]|nr:hypothetical protein NMY22_g16515 [Coprinellus aureogranulatus]